MSKDYTIGALVGRFQVHELHEAHHYLIKQVVDNHKKVILFLGVSKVVGTKKNPLDFETRKKMIQHHYPDIVILALPDFGDDRRWSHELDKRIKEVYPIGDVLLYGGRDSFIPYYKNGGGQFDCKELEQYTFVSGTEVRKMVSSEVKDSQDFRAGMIYQSYNQYPKVHPCVDIAILNEEEDKVLLAKRPFEDGWRFIGGFSKPTDVSYEHTARRKVSEDAGRNLSVNTPIYVGSVQIPDWRYQSEEDKILSILFITKKEFGSIQPSDDISELKFFNIDELKEENFVKEHKVLLEMFLKNKKYSNFK
jgi:bifunctional NMN adenylyltransferase/nudix hydrolase